MHNLILKVLNRKDAKDAKGSFCWFCSDPGRKIQDHNTTKPLRATIEWARIRSMESQSGSYKSTDVKVGRFGRIITDQFDLGHYVFKTD